MREIEIKARVSDQATLLAVLQSQNIEVSEPVIQRDRVFGVHWEAGGGTNSSPWLRIRTETHNDITKHIFTLKKAITNQMDNIEHETAVDDVAELAKIIGHLGFTPYSDLTKTRRKAQIGEIEICIDTVEGLGNFIEAEKLTPEDVDYDTVASELWAVLERFGVSRDDHVADGYDVLMRQQNI